MKQIIAGILFLLPTYGMAQTEWEKPETKPAQQEIAKVNKQQKNTIKEENQKYLEGAVPIVDGKVVFTLELDVPGQQAGDIYQTVYQVLENITKESNQHPESSIALVNKKEHIIAAKYKEWLVFQNSLLSLDRTVFHYTIIAHCYDNRAKITLSRISYAYEMNRSNNKGLEEVAENWIVDKYALNKKKTKLSKVTGKFRRKTIDRKDEIFQLISNQLLKATNNIQ